MHYYILHIYLYCIINNMIVKVHKRPQPPCTDHMGKPLLTYLHSLYNYTFRFLRLKPLLHIYIIASTCDKDLVVCL